MDNADKTKQFFLVGTGVLVLLMVAGLVWAVMTVPENQTTGDSTQVGSNVIFNDAGNPAIGLAEAKVTVRIFSDFQCPACRVAEGPLRKVMEAYKDRVRFIWNDFPLTSIHPNAMAAAVAGRCADAQGRFWQFSDKVFESQAQWSKLTAPSAYFADIAESVGIQKDSFTTCLAADLERQKVVQDIQEASSIGLDSTPTFIVNRTVYSGGMDQTAWAKILDAALLK